MNRKFISSLLSLTLIVFIASCGGNSSSNSEEAGTEVNTNEEVHAPMTSTTQEVSKEDHGGMISKDSFDKVIAGNKLTMVDFYTTWCGPCKMMAPFVQQIKVENADIVNVIQVDAEAQLDIASRYNIQGYPTLIFFKGGQIVFEALGGRGKADLLALVNKYK